MTVVCGADIVVLLAAPLRIALGKANSVFLVSDNLFLAEGGTAIKCAISVLYSSRLRKM